MLQAETETEYGWMLFSKDIWQLITERGEGPENPDSASVIAGLSHVGEM